MIGLASLAPLRADEPETRTPRAGERVVRTVLGKTIVVEARDRSRSAYLGLGAVLLPSGPSGLQVSPAGGLEIWRETAGRDRFRAVLAGIANEVRWDRAALRGRPVFAVLAADTLTLPWARSEYVQGERRRAEELEWHQARAGVGAAWRRPIGPGAVDNELDAALTLEGGGLFFARGDRTAPDYVRPRNTAEGRLHLRVRADALERNLLELPHAGWAAGTDVTGARRARWDPWGAPDAGLETGGRSWAAASVFGIAAFGPPGASERHRLIASVHAGNGTGLDRFSSFRLGSGSTWGDVEMLSHAVLPAAGVDEIATSRYAIADLEYRFEALFFLYLQARGTLAWAERPIHAAARLASRTGSFPAFSFGFTTGLPWGLAMELAVSRSFGLESFEDGRAEKGRTGFLVTITRSF